MYDNILLPTDGSDGMTEIIDHACALAEVHDATVHALYVVNTASLSDLPMESSWEGVSTALQNEGEHALSRVEERAGDVDLVREMIDGSPAKEIVSYASDNDCDVIVMGTHGRSGVDRLLLGSVAERVVRSSEVPVLTIRVSESD
jgi:nucleotide-binding universal stress UspA family protein